MSGSDFRFSKGCKKTRVGKLVVKGQVQQLVGIGDGELTYIHLRGGVVYEADDESDVVGEDGQANDMIKCLCRFDQMADKIDVGQWIMFAGEFKTGPDGQPEFVVEQIFF